MSRVRPLVVFSFPPRSTIALAKRPLAILVTRFAFFMAFIAFIAFMAFIAFIAFIAFMASAIVGAMHWLNQRCLRCRGTGL